MAKTSHQVSIHVEVSDKKALYAAAQERAKEDGLEAAEARSLLKPGGVISVSACLIMLFDPGTSPAGCSILDSVCD